MFPSSLREDLGVHGSSPPYISVMKEAGLLSVQ